VALVRSFRAHRPVVWFMLAGLAAVTVIGLVGVNIVRRISTDQAIANARDLTEADARSLQENFTDGMLAGDPEARLVLDRAIRTRLLTNHVVRVKVWDADGRIVASDEGSLVGRRFTLPEDERNILGTDGVSAESSDLTRPENARERKFGHLLEVYVGTHTPSGTPLLFESYLRYETITASGNRMLIAFAPALVGGLLLLWLAQLPLALALERRLRRSRDRERELLVRAIESSDRVRRRIAADLHDSVVQDLAGSSMSLAALARVVRERGDTGLAEDLDVQAADLRQRIRDLRTLVVAIAPRRLHDEGLAAALEDLASTVRARGIETHVEVASPLPLDRAGEALLFRGAQEAVRNTIDHTVAEHVDIAVANGDGRVRLRVHDDGAGFDPVVPPGDGSTHLGLALLADLAVDAGGELAVESAPGAGTTVVLEVPVG
jgi:signal transduction histidine kinase